MSQDSLYYFYPTESAHANAIMHAPLEQADSGYHAKLFTLEDYKGSAGHQDSTLSAQSGNPSLQFINFYKGHQLKAIHSEPLPRENSFQDWFFPVFMIVLIIYTWSRIFYYKYFNQLIQAFWNSNLTNQIVRDENILVQRASILLALNFNMIASLFLYLLSLQAGWALGGIGPGFYRFIFFLTIISAAYTFKFLILKIAGWLFDLDREMATYIFTIFLINNILGLVLVPIVALMAYNPSVSSLFLAQVSLIIIGLGFIYRILRGLMGGISVPGFSPLYLFLYLCTLEIAPLLVLIRIVNP